MKAKSIKLVKATALLLCSGALLSACDVAKVTKMGIFTDSPTEGLHYSGPSFSGLTNRDGEFKYRQGETVTFSLGGTVLGSTKGAAVITPLSLFGATPPTTEAEIREEFAKSSSDFQKAVNIVTLLVRLDLDGNPDNGIDLTGLHIKLANLETDFGQHATRFGGYLESQLANEDENDNKIRVQVSKPHPLLHFYKSLGIKVSVKALKKTEVDAYDNGVINQVYEKEFNVAGQLISESNNNDNDDHINELTTYAYDVNGFRTEKTKVEDVDDNGVIDTDDRDRKYFNNTSYTDNGKPLTKSFGGFTSVRYRPSITDETYVYDTQTGKASKKTKKYDRDHDGVDNIRETTATFDDDGQVTSLKERYDNNGDGTFTNENETTFTYDEKGNQIKRESDSNQIVQTFNDDNQLLTRRDGQDHNGDGEIDDTYSLETYTYDATHGKPLSYTRQSGYDDSDDTYNYKKTITKSYDENVNLIGSIQEEYRNKGAVLYSRITKTKTLDEHGNTLTDYRGVEQENRSNVLEFSYSDSNTYTYDNHKRLLTILTVYKDDSYEDSSLRTNTYDSGGRITQSTLEKEYDDDVAGYDETQTVKAAYDEDGVQTSYSVDLTYADTDSTARSVKYMHTVEAGIITKTVQEEGAEGDLYKTAKLYEYVTIEDGLAYLLEHGIEDGVACTVHDGTKIENDEEEGEERLSLKSVSAKRSRYDDCNASFGSGGGGDSR